MTVLNDITNNERQLEFIYINRYKISKRIYHILLAGCNISYEPKPVLPTVPQLHIAGKRVASINLEERVSCGLKTIKHDRDLRNQNYISYKINTTVIKKSQLF